MNIIKIGYALYDVGKAAKETVEATESIVKDLEQRNVLLTKSGASFGKKAFTILETVLVEGFQNWDTIKPALKDDMKALRELWAAFKTEPDPEKDKEPQPDPIPLPGVPADPKPEQPPEPEPPKVIAP